MLMHKQNCTASISEGKVTKLVVPEWSVDAWHRALREALGLLRNVQQNDGDSESTAGGWIKGA
jgi:hypothetical protein